MQEIYQNLRMNVIVLILRLLLQEILMSGKALYLMLLRDLIIIREIGQGKQLIDQMVFL